VVEGEFGNLGIKDSAEQAIRTSLAIITEGIAAAAPIEGITHVDIKNNFDGSSYLSIYFAGPIRSAGGTAAALAVLIGDFVRRKLDISYYISTDLEVERFFEEVEIYDGIKNLQYSPSETEVKRAVENIPVEISGEPTEHETVTGYRDLDRIETNRVRGGAVLALAEGVLQKAPKLMKHIKNLELDGWNWLSESINSSSDEEETTKKYPKGDKYLKDIIAGRAVFGYPQRPGGFRLRYGRARNTGLAANGVHPATMRILNNHISTGTQLKTERPGKATAAAPVDSVEGPIVKLRDGSVTQVNSEEKAIELRDKVTEILSLGDMLIGFGEFLENNHSLMPAGYCEEWWAEEVKELLNDNWRGSNLEPYLDPSYKQPPVQLAVEISEELNAPLHPSLTYFYHDLDLEELEKLGNWLANGKPKFSDKTLESVELELEEEPKRILERLGVPHKVEANNVTIGNESLPLYKCLGLIQEKNLDSKELISTINENTDKNTLEVINLLTDFPVRAKAPTRIGCRMGRPEKAKPRKMSPPPHILFPIGLKGGSTRSIPKAADNDSVELEVANSKCPNCDEFTFKKKCPNCGENTEIVGYCRNCDDERPAEDGECISCGSRIFYYSEREVKLKSLLNEALENLQESMPDEIKGVKGMTSKYKLPEPLEKGILRSKHDVYVFKDGTTRFDATDLPITHFRPREISVSVERLKELGYEKDFQGEPLESENQVLELKPQDILLSEPCVNYLLKSTGFVDELLEEFYDLPAYYDANNKEDLIGHLIIGLAPHTSAGITGRIIGFSEARVGYAHPYFHAAKRRNCDGDEDAIMLLLDALLNFSQYYLPETRGGKMDAPLVLTTRLDPREVDDEVHNLDISSNYPVEFYEETQHYEDPNKLTSKIETVKDRLGKSNQYQNLEFTRIHNPKTISAGPKECQYKSLGPMTEKANSQLELGKKIMAVDESDVAERLIEHHFIPDLKGNLRAFSRQQFRCTTCNRKYRRVPLDGKCSFCGGNLILTVNQGGVEKYMKIATKVAEDYGVTNYTKQRLGIVKREITSVFQSDIKKQLSLADFA
ncbi:MAG: DNA polymerase II large subunit, partial [Hadesarchaea archaeon]|nr:DNA polymerase II large subunit [Hadesarchaea archaeon]